MSPIRPVVCGIVPPYLLENIARRGSERQRAAATRALALDLVHRQARTAGRPTVTVTTPAEDGPRRTVATADGSETLPGRLVRSEGEPATGDAAADEAYDGLGATYDLYLSAYDRHSVDDAGLPLPATVHYGRDYDNAFWDGERMVFGDGDGELFLRFTIAVDVIGHELTHARDRGHRRAGLPGPVRRPERVGVGRVRLPGQADGCSVSRRPTPTG